MKYLLKIIYYNNFICVPLEHLFYTLLINSCNIIFYKNTYMIHIIIIFFLIIIIIYIIYVLKTKLLEIFMLNLIHCSYMVNVIIHRDQINEDMMSRVLISEFSERSPLRNVRNIEFISDSFGLRIYLTVRGLYDKLVCLIWNLFMASSVRYR